MTTITMDPNGTQTPTQEQLPQSCSLVLSWGSNTKFGNIPNVPIFAKWDNRKDCAASGVHGLMMAGIQGNKTEGVFAVALSGLYGDDEDGGDIVIYTGAGGREKWSNDFPPKRLRLGPQTLDQSWDHPSNKALIASFFTGNPIRLIRSSKCHSQYAPESGYRYDGLYKVTAYWTAKGRNEKDVCRCRLERLSGQPPIPIRPITMSTSRRGRPKRLVSGPTPYPLPPADIQRLPDQPSVSPAQLEMGPEGLQSTPPSQAVSEPSVGIDFNLGELEIDIKPQLPSSPPPCTSSEPNSLPRYRWDPRKHELVRVPATTSSNTVSENGSPREENEEENRIEDDATLVQSDAEQVGDHMEMEHPSDIVDFITSLVQPEHVGGRVETEYHSDIGVGDELHAPGSSVAEN